jgi:hypothetical protein
MRGVRPDLVCFDLDGCLWWPEMDMTDGGARLACAVCASCTASARCSRHETLKSSAGFPMGSAVVAAVTPFPPPPRSTLCLGM